MPSIFAVASVSLVAAAAQSATATAHLYAGTVDWEATATVELDGGVTALAQPSAGTVQEAGVEFYVGAVQIPPDKLVGGWSISRSRRQPIQGFSFSLALDEWGQSWAGDAFAALGPPLGTQELNVYGVYRRDSDGKVYRLPLISKGVADNMVRESSPTAGHFDTYECHDKAARYARKPLTIIFPAGHGLSRGRMVGKMFTTAGETQIALDDGRRGWVERQFVDADLFGAAQEVYDLEGRVVRYDRFGSVVAPKLWQPSAPIVATLTEEDILAISTVRLQFPGDVITEVTATGTEQLHSAGPAVCGEVSSTPVEVRTVATFSPFVATYRQTTGCTLTTLGLDEEQQEQLQTLTISRQVKRCGAVVREETETWQHYNEKASRYRQNGASRDCLECYLGTDGTANGAEEAYLRIRAAWAMIGRTVTRRYFDADGYGGPPVDLGAGNLDQSFVRVLGSTPTGRYLGSITDTEGFYNVRTATKQRTAGQVFDELNPRNSVYFTGPGDTVLAANETFQRTTRVVEVVRANALGYLENVKLYTRGFAVSPGGVTAEYQFADGALSDNPDETELTKLTESTDYLSTEENTHAEVTVRAELGRSPVINSQTGLAGAPPAVEYLPGYGPYDPNAFMDAEDQTFSETARDGETRPIKVTVSAPELLLTHLPRAHKAAFPYAEDTEDLNEAATSIIVESLVVPFAITLPANFTLSEGDSITVTHRPVGVVAQRCVIDTIRWEGGAQPGTPTLTHLALQIYPPVPA